MKKIGISIVAMIMVVSAMAQQDTLSHSRSLDSVVVISYLNQNIVRPLPNVQGSYILSGKKTEMIDLAQAAADITNKTGRQLFAKVPGVFVYHMDGTGNQINISARGLDPHRGWEFNLRKDGVLTNSDMYGYPASHYSMPLESIAKIELVRGTGSLQYGAQFGGMLNYITKQGDTTRPISFESINTAGSYNLLSTYNAIGGKSGKFKYYAYMHKKSRDGYRDNEHTNSEAQAMIVTYEPTARFSIRAEWSRSKYLYRIPGPLTDSMFYADPEQASRSRNYYSPDIHLPSISIGWQLAAKTKLQFTQSAVLGKRESVQFDKPVNIKDTINATTLQYNNRQVDIDNYRSYTTELRLLQEYKLGKGTNLLAAGIQYMNNNMHRRQMGKGSAGSDYDLTLAEPGWGRDLHLKTKNIALFAENKFQVLKNLSVGLGARVEIGKTDMKGSVSYYPANDLPVSIRHEFPLLGANFSYVPAGNLEVYGGWSQAYHPMLFADLIPASTFERVDPNIKDAKGYNAELGFRGSWRFLRWDMTGFLLQYDRRFGKLAQMDNNGNFYTWRTNAGNSFTKGAEILVQADFMLDNRIGLSFFTSTAFLDAKYKTAFIKSGNNENININGNKVESVPNLITRNGASLRYKKFSFSILYSYTAKSFADPLNTVIPPKATGAVGLVPSYGLVDLGTSFRFSGNIEARINLNNVLNKEYFTKRPQLYPGPGVWPSDGRNGSMTLIIRI